MEARDNTDLWNKLEQIIAVILEAPEPMEDLTKRDNTDLYLKLEELKTAIENSGGGGGGLPLVDGSGTTIDTSNPNENKVDLGGLLTKNVQINGGFNDFKLQNTSNILLESNSGSFSINQDDSEIKISHSNGTQILFDGAIGTLLLRDPANQQILLDPNNAEITLINSYGNKLELISDTTLEGSADVILRSQNGTEINLSGEILISNNAAQNGIKYDTRPLIWDNETLIDKKYFDDNQSGASPLMSLQSSMLGSANATIGLFSKSSSTTGANPSGIPVTSPSNSFQNGAIDPYKIPDNSEVVGVCIALSGAAVSTASVNSDPTMRLAVYTHEKATRTLIGNIDIPLPNALIGVFNNANFTPSIIKVDYILSVPLNIPSGSIFGWEFVNRNGDNVISAISVCECTFVTRTT